MKCLCTFCLSFFKHNFVDVSRFRCNFIHARTSLSIEYAYNLGVGTLQALTDQFVAGICLQNVVHIFSTGGAISQPDSSFPSQSAKAPFMHGDFWQYYTRA